MRSWQLNLLFIVHSLRVSTTRCATTVNATFSEFTELPKSELMSSNNVETRKPFTGFSFQKYQYIFLSTQEFGEFRFAPIFLFWRCRHTCHYNPLRNLHSYTSVWKPFLDAFLEVSVLRSHFELLWDPHALADPFSVFHLVLETVHLRHLGSRRRERSSAHPGKRKPTAATSSSMGNQQKVPCCGP